LKYAKNREIYQTIVDCPILYRMNISRPAPIANQLNDILRERFFTGVYPPGVRLPSESVLASEFGVSRATIRTVMASLASEGLILRKQGDGTYLNPLIQQVNTHLGGVWEFRRLIESSGYKATIQSLSIETRAATDKEIAALGLQPGSQVLALRRLFFADLKPVILATNTIPRAMIDESAGPMDGTLDIREILRRFCGKKIAFAISDLRASLANGEITDILQCEPGRPLLQILIVFYDQDNHPLVYGQSYYDDTTLRLRLVQTWG
jgi:GntR family transcriptional regulator